jgi:hypothetical protein
MCGARYYPRAKRDMENLTKEVLSGFNILSLAGFVIMGLGLTLSRTGKTSVPVSIGLMGVGTALVFFGLYPDWSR